ncbi:MAG: S9 family peptidase [Candidatus Dormibacteraceae bacterium]
MAGNVARHGSWRSPITGAMLGTPMVFSQTHLAADRLFWIERRPREGGRNVIVAMAPDGELEDVIPAGFNARTSVHEYGGGDFTTSGGAVWFSNFEDQRLYRREGSGDPAPITPAGRLRYADPVFDPPRDRLICVREDHGAGALEPVNTLVSVPAAGGEQTVLAEGRDFYSFPRISPDGALIAWTEWDHPNLPWNGTELWLGELAADGSIASPRRIAGGPEESVGQPRWSPGGVLHFVSDRTGWSNLYRWLEGATEAICPMEAEFGYPQWQFAMSYFDFASEELIVCAICRSGLWSLALLDARTGGLETVDQPYLHIADVTAGGGRAYFTASSPAEPPSVVEFEIAGRRTTVLRHAHDMAIDGAYISNPRPIEFATAGGSVAHALYFPPVNPDFEGPPGEAPPLLVDVHGGPTACYAGNARAFELDNQFWTSRGFALVQLDYGGSAGYGREYWQRLHGEWGVVDVEDSVTVARDLVEKGLADPHRLIIRGGSAGGYTTLCAAAFRDVFTAGASYFGVADLDSFGEETHKFESRYLDWLVRPTDRPGRSAINFADRITMPLLILQGSEDHVVPPDQAQTIVRALRGRGVPFAYLLFEGEGHGFRRAESIRRSREAELYFYSRVFGFDLAEPVEPIEIENLPG